MSKPSSSVFAFKWRLGLQRDASFYIRHARHELWLADNRKDFPSTPIFFKTPGKLGPWCGAKGRLWEEINEAVALDPATSARPSPMYSNPPPSSPTQMCITSCALLSPHLCSCSQPFYTNPSLLKTQQSNVWVPVQPSHPSHLWLKIFAYCSKTGKYKIYHFNHFKCIVQ